MANTHSNFAVPIILQWNVHSVKDRLSNLRIPLQTEPIEIQTLQTSRVPNHEARLAGFAGYHSKSQQPNGNCRVSLFVRKDIPYTFVNLDSFSSPDAEHAAVSIRDQGGDATIVSIYVQPAVAGDPSELFQVRQHCAESSLCFKTLTFITKHRVSHFPIITVKSSSTSL